MTQTLADFARAIGINPSLARQWKRRGKIVERDGGFELPGTLTHHGPSVTFRDESAAACNCGMQICAICRPRKMQPPLTLSGILNAKCESVTIKPCGDPGCSACRSLAEQMVEGQSHWTVEPAPLPETVTVASQWEDVTQPESVTSVTPWLYKPLPLVTDCPTCHGPRWACDCAPLEDLAQIELLTKDNRILSDAVDSLRDLTTEQGRMLSDAIKRLTLLEALFQQSGQDNVRLTRWVEALQGRVNALDAENRELRQLWSETESRVVALQVETEANRPFADKIAKAFPELLQRIDDPPQLSRVKNGIIDPPSSGWGA